MFAQREGFEVVDVFDDEAESGALFERPGLLRALAAAGRNEFEVLIAYDQDRFSRGIWSKLGEEAEDIGLRLMTSDGAIDSADDENEFTADVLDAAAKKYRKTQTRKSMESRAYRVKNGFHVGGRPPFGHESQPQVGGGARLVVNLEEQRVVERAVELILDERRTPSETADLLNAEGFTKRGARWTSRNLVQTLDKSSLAGRFVYGKERRAKTKYDAARFGIEGLEVEVPSVVEPHRWKATQELLAKTRWTKKTAHTYPLSRRIETEDGHLFVGLFDTSNQKRRYRCASRYTGSDCSHKSLSADLIEAAVWWALEEQFRTMDELYEMLDAMASQPTDEEAAIAARDHHASRVQTLRRERVKTEARGLRQGFSKDAVQAALDEIDADIRTEESELRAATDWAANARAASSRREVLKSWEAFGEVFASPDLTKVKELYDAIDLRVVLCDDGTADVHIGLPLEHGLDVLRSQHGWSLSCRRCSRDDRRSPLSHDSCWTLGRQSN